MAHPYDETLGFPALMITISQDKNLDNATLINVTHSNINTSDISRIFYNIPSIDLQNILLP